MERYLVVDDGVIGDVFSHAGGRGSTLDCDPFATELALVRKAATEASGLSPKALGDGPAGPPEDQGYGTIPAASALPGATACCLLR